MKISCSSCTSYVTIDDRFMYDLESQGSKLKCKSCNSPLNLKGIPKLCQGDENNLLYGKFLNEDVVKNLKKLYPMPHVTYKARKLINSVNAGFQEIGNILKTDPALAARIMKVANSAYYGMSGKISSLHHASTLLGGRTLIQIITLVSQSKALGRSLKGYDIQSGDMWKHSLQAAVCANILSVKRSPEEEEDSFFAGLMHDSGKIILDGYVVEREQIFNRYMITSQAGFLRAEQRILGFDHAHTGYELCLKWNLPEKLAYAIKYHHNPVASGGNKLAYILFIADYMAKFDQDGDEKDMSKVYSSLEFLGFKKEDMGDLQEEAYNATEALEEDTY